MDVRASKALPHARQTELCPGKRVSGSSCCIKTPFPFFAGVL